MSGCVARVLAADEILARIERGINIGIMKTTEEIFSPIRWAGDHLLLLDQTKLPREEVWLQCRQPEDVAAAIYRLSVRGAPAIGVSAAYGLVVGMLSAEEGADPRQRFAEVSDLLGQTRPTAVNLRWALDRGRAVFDAAADEGREMAVARLLEWAHEVHAADIEANKSIGAFGADLFAAEDRVLTHCNTGALATAGYGTALGVIRSSWSAGKVKMVWVDETRPLLQGARLTAWELEALGIPFRVVTDSSAGSLMTQGLVDRVVVGADRIAANGDAANKIGTYPLAVLAQRHQIPFYVAAPISTIDAATPSGSEIPIEERDPMEVKQVFGTEVTPSNAEAANFAFDVTPNDLITAIITDVGVLWAPYESTIAAALSRDTEVE